MNASTGIPLERCTRNAISTSAPVAAASVAAGTRRRAASGSVIKSSNAERIPRPPTTRIAAGAWPQSSSCANAVSVSATAMSAQRSITPRRRMGGTYCAASAGASARCPMRLNLEGYDEIALGDDPE